MSGGPVTDLYARLRKNYCDVHSAAKALYFMSKDTRNPEGSFRFESDLGWEFAQGWYIGPDPAGDFYYRKAYFDADSKSRLDPNKKTEASFYTEVLTEQGEEYVHITFYVPGSTIRVLGEFIGKDEFGRATKYKFKDRTYSGTWQAKDYEEVECYVSKAKDETTITLEQRGGTVKVEVDCDPKKDLIFKEAIDDVHGKLYIRNRSTVATEGSSVRWYSDYAVFYRGWNAKEFAAFFYPDEGHKHPLGSQKDDYEWDNVRWSLRG